MELPTYDTLEDFKKYYLDALANFPELNGNKLNLLRRYETLYQNVDAGKREEYNRSEYENEVKSRLGYEKFEELQNLSDNGQALTDDGIPILLMGPYGVADYFCTINEISEDDSDIIYRYLEEKGEKEAYYEENIKPIEIILDYIKSEIDNEQQNLLRFQNHSPAQQTSQTQQTGIPEQDYFDTPNLQRVIILEKLGVIDYIKSLQNNPENEKHTSEILSSFTGINSSTIAKNLGVMLGHKKNDADKNSPYKNPENLQLANNKLSNFNVDLTKRIR